MPDDELKLLWDRHALAKVWGKGQSLHHWTVLTNHMPDAANIPAGLCGGTHSEIIRRSEEGAKKMLLKIHLA